MLCNAELIARYESAGDVAALAALARGLIAKPARKPKAPAGVEPRLLLPYELAALDLIEPKVRIGGGAYEWVLVTFADGTPILTGAYPRVGDTGHFAAQQSARRRYVRMHSKDRGPLSTAITIPEIASAEILTDPARIDVERERCAAFRLEVHGRVRAAELARVAEAQRRIDAKWAKTRDVQVRLEKANRYSSAFRLSQRTHRWAMREYERAVAA